MAFKGTPTVFTRTHGGPNDKTPAKLGSLSAGGMTNVGGLAGVSGNETVLVTGDRDHLITGNQTEKITKDQKTNIVENHTWDVGEKLTSTVHSTTTDNRWEDYNQYFHAKSLFQYFETHTDHHLEAEEEHNPTHTFHILGWEGDVKSVEMRGIGACFEGKGLSVDASLVSSELVGFGTENWGAKIGKGLFENVVCVNSVQEKALDLRLEGMQHQIDGLKTHTSSLKVLIMPTRLGLCVAIHIDSPVA